jgi:hypothetical protein
MRHSRKEAMREQGGSTREPRQQASALIPALVLGLVLGLDTPAAAQEGQGCAAEPTDELIEYGDVRSCWISPVGDVDVYRFIGQAGDSVLVQLSEVSGIDASPALELVRPDGSSFSAKSHHVTVRIDAILDEPGVWTILVDEAGGDEDYAYTLVLESVIPVSPTASPLCSGCTEPGGLNPKGDLDLFVFEGSEGAKVELSLSETSGIGSYPSLELYRPDGTRHSALDHHATVVLTVTLDQTGTWTAVVGERDQDDTMTYNLSRQCLVGDCGSAAQLVLCDVQMSSGTYGDGDLVQVASWRLANLGDEPRPVEMKVWLRLPGPGAVPIVSDGSAGEFVLPPGFDIVVGPFDLFPVGPGVPLGAYEFGCRLLDPVTGESLDLDAHAFSVE